MWIMVNTLQIVNYIIMFTLYYPKILIMLVWPINLANMENQYFSTIFLYTVNQNQIQGKESWDYRFDSQGISSTSILINCSDTFFALLLVCLYYLIIICFCCIIKNMPKQSRIRKYNFCLLLITKVVRKIHKIRSEIFCNTIIRIGLESYLVVFFAALYNTCTMTFKNATDYYANIVAFICLILNIGLFAFAIYFIISKQSCRICKFDILSKEFKEGK